MGGKSEIKESNAQKKRMADKILYHWGLWDELCRIGKPHIIGSYRMDMMALNDLDIDIENGAMSLKRLHELTEYILHAFQPLWYEAKEEVTDEGKTVWFHGFEALIEGERWNLDLWFFDEETIDRAKRYCDKVAQAADQMPGGREHIIQIKQDLLARGWYGFGRYTSMDVYRAVLEQGIQSADELQSRYVRAENRL